MIRLLILCGLLAPGLALAWSDADEARYRAMLEELRCLVCQNQSLADSSAELAGDLRDQVRDQIEAGRSDAEIRSYMTARYGDFVLYRPPLKRSTWALWLGPFALLLLGLVVLLRLRRAPSATPRPAPDAPDADALRRILAAEERDGTNS